MMPQLRDPRRQEDDVHDLASLIRTSVLLAVQGWRKHDDAVPFVTIRLCGWRSVRLRDKHH